MKIQSKPDYLVFADSAKKGENSDFPDVSRGWGITIDQTASKPPMEWMNGAFNRIDRNMLYLLQQGVPEWSELVKYPANAIIKYNGVLYTAIAENDNAKPSTNTTKWKKTQTEITGASTTQSGVVKLNSSTNSTLETEAATPKAVKVAYDLANTAKSNAGNAQTKADSAYTLANTANTTANSAKSIAETDASTSKKGRIKLNSSTNSTSETEAATPLAVKKAYDNIEKKVLAITASSIGAITKNEADSIYVKSQDLPTDVEYIYPVGMGGEVTNNSSYEYPDPYSGKSVQYLPEVFYGQHWLHVGFIFGSSNSYGARVITLGEKIYITTGNNGLLEPSSRVAGIPQQFLPPSTQKRLPFRLKVIK